MRLLSFGFIIIIVFIFVVISKYRSMLKAADGLSEINWIDQDWTPLKIIMTTFREEGKIAKLSVIEAALFIGLPINKILSIMLRKLQRQGAVKLHEDGRIKLVNANFAKDKFEKELLNTVDINWKLNLTKVKTLIQRMLD